MGFAAIESSLNKERERERERMKMNKSQVQWRSHFIAEFSVECENQLAVEFIGIVIYLLFLFCLPQLWQRMYYTWYSC